MSLTIASDLADPASVHAASHALTLWGWEEYDNTVTGLWVTDSDDLASDLVRLQVMQNGEGTWYLSGGDVEGSGYGTGAGTGYGTGEWYIDEIHALKQKSDLVRITTSTSGNGMISPVSPNGELQVPPNSDQWFTITPGPGALLNKLLVDTVEKIENCTESPETGTFRCVLQVDTTDQTIKAIFQSASGTAAITTSILGNGSISPGSITLDKGASQGFIITSDADAALTSLTINDDEKVGNCPAAGDCTYTFANVAADSTITASFQPADQVATIQAWAYERAIGHLFDDLNDNGVQDADEPDLEDVAVVITDHFGDTQTFTTNKNGTYSANVPVGKAVTIDVVEATLPDGVVKVAGADLPIASGCSIVPAGNVKVEKNGSLAFTMVPDNKYQFVDVYVKSPDETIWRSVYGDEGDIEDLRDSDGRLLTYTFSSVPEDSQLKVRFAKEEAYSLSPWERAGERAIDWFPQTPAQH